MMKLTHDGESFLLSFQGRKVIAHDARHPAIRMGRASARYRTRHGSFKIRQQVEHDVALRAFRVVLATPARIEVILGETLTLVACPREGRLEISLSCSDKTLNRLWLRMPAEGWEHIYGCGEQFTHLDLKGRRVPLWCEEQGIGRGRDAISLLADVFHGAGGSWHTTYFPQPTFLSSANYFLHADTTAYAEFDFRKRDRHELAFWEIPERLVFGAADSAPLLIESLSAFLGRQPPLPEWAYAGTWLGIQGGAQRMNEILEKSLAAGVPVTAIWAQDWEGRRVTSFGKQLMWNWEYDRDLYPDLPNEIARLRNRGIRYLGYINPFLATEKNLYQEAVEKGLLVRKSTREVDHVVVTTFPAGVLDLSNPETQRWIKEVIKTNMIGIGLSGWMADFGEYLSVENISLHSGADPERFHNLYPVLWAKVNREAILEAGLQDEVTFFSRAGHAGSSRHAPIVWAGDQLVNWSHDDGLATVIPAGISLGLSGIGVTHSDIGGYTTVAWIKRSKELLQRWTEQAAFTAIMRTHEGNRPDDNWQFHGDAETLAHFARMSRLHAGLKPYVKAMLEEYQAHGLPLMRHPFIHYEKDEVLHKLKYQYLFGRDLLVAPVCRPGKTSRKVYLPEDEWIHLWSEQKFTKGWHTVPAPLGEPPVFLRAASPWRETFLEARAAAELPSGNGGTTKGPLQRSS